MNQVIYHLMYYPGTFINLLHGHTLNHKKAMKTVNKSTNQAEGASQFHDENSGSQTADFLSRISAPARRALLREGINTLHQLSAYTEQDLLSLHGLGKSTLPKLQEALAAAGLHLASSNIPKERPYSVYHTNLNPNDKAIVDALATIIDRELQDAECKLWHAHPVWFLQGNPIVGYSLQKNGIRLMFWSGADFNEAALNIIGPKFKDASIVFTSIHNIDRSALIQWLRKARAIQWDYKNLIKRKGKLEKLT